MTRTLLILLWKHLTVRKRKFVHTVVELASPMVFFLIIFLVRGMLIPMGRIRHYEDANSTTVNMTDILPLDRIRGPSLVLYTPDTDFTRQIMDNACPKLGLLRLQTFPSDRARGYYAYNNESLTSFIEKTKDNIAIVIFPNVENVPDKLNYTIRMKKHFMVNIYESLDDTVGPHQKFGEMYEPFLRLQWAIDSAFLGLSTDSNLDLSVSIQEFPYVSTSSNSHISTVCSVVTLLCHVSLSLPFIFLMSKLLEERASGIQELIKMVGVKPSLLCMANYINMVPTGLVYGVSGAAFLTASANPLVPNTNPFLIFVMLELHFFSIMALAFVTSYFSNSSRYAVSLSVLVYMLSWLPVSKLSTVRIHAVLRPLAGLIPHNPMAWFWAEVAQLETFGSGINFSTMWTSHTAFSGSVFSGYILMLVQTALFFMLAWYLSFVRPGKYGTGMPWNFLFMSQYWGVKKVSPDELIMDDTEEDPIAHDPLYFEEKPASADVGIRVANVSKVFGKQRALSNVSFDVYKGEIMVLLGHNGAGKTTLMSIITGMLAATDGKVVVNGLDSVSEQTAVRRQLGLCPQHNLFFPDLTVMEHVMLFTMLKGRSFAEARKSCGQLLSNLGIDNKANNQSKELSGGMKRRLQLACALAGGADVLILDEPTSGLDVETRRGLWDLLLSLRGTRTVLLTTHFMEEADALGDRVAALHAGKLKCHATPMYLKRNIGSGYRLSLTTIGLPREPAITNAIVKVVPDATLKEKSLNSILYTLPTQASPAFNKLFGELEDNRSELGIDSIGVGVSTLEEVFLRLCSDVDTNFGDDEVDGRAEEIEKDKQSGFRLWLRQVFMLFRRQFLFLMSKKITFVCLQVILPVTMICLVTYSLSDLRGDERPRADAVSMDLNVYRDMAEKRVFYDADDAALRKVTDLYPQVQFRPTKNVANVLRSVSLSDVSEYNKYLAGIELDDTRAKVLYSTTVRHTLPVAMNLLSNMVAARLLPDADGRTITTYNYPLKDNFMFNIDEKLTVEPMSAFAIIFWVIFVAFVMLGTIVNATSLPCSERISGARHIHVMSGCSPSLHWSSTLLFHTVLYSAALVLPTLVSVASFNSQHTLDQPDFVGVLAVVIILGCMAFLAFAYLVSQFLASRGCSLVLTVVLLVFGLITAPTKTFADLNDIHDMNVIVRFVLTISLYLMPTHTFIAAGIYAGNVARLNAFCTLNRNSCPNIDIMKYGLIGFDVEKCCVLKQNPMCYFCLDTYSPLKYIIVLVVQIIVYMTLVILTEHGVFKVLWVRLVNCTYNRPPMRYADKMAKCEAAYVNQNIAQPKNQIRDAMLVDNVQKKYCRPFKKACHAVKGISFSVKKGECFGILGVNGAGKSTTFKMITGEEFPTRGSVYANGQNLNWHNQQYLESLGYCPQFFGLDDFLTGTQNLELLLTLRGFDSGAIEKEAASWITIVGLEKHAKKPVSGYSGGCTRRLATAAALCVGASVTLLDEPTSGVDVSARRRVWRACRAALAQHRAIIVTSHSMDEMEALCSRIAILSGGEVAALGTPASLRAAYAAGHAVRIKIKTAADETDGANSELQNLKAAMLNEFNCTLKDEHKTMLHYHINTPTRHSSLFSALEHLKARFPNLVEDYCVTETTLEEVFLSFAQDAHNTDAEIQLPNDVAAV